MDKFEIIFLICAILFWYALGLICVIGAMNFLTKEESRYLKPTPLTIKMVIKLSLICFFGVFAFGFVLKRYVIGKNDCEKIKKCSCTHVATACDDCKKRFLDWLHEDEGWRRIHKVGEFAESLPLT